MKSDDMVLLTSRAIQSLLTLDECIDAVEHAFLVYGEDKAVPPAVLSMHANGGGFHVKARLLEPSRSYFAAKGNGNFPENSSRFGLPKMHGVIILCGAGNGTPLAVMDSRDITTLRTAAATAVAAKFLARQNSRTITICGCENQRRMQIKALSRVRRLETDFAYHRDGEQALRFSNHLKSEPGISTQPASDLTPAVLQGDICVPCATSLKPWLGSDGVSPGTFIAAGRRQPSETGTPPKPHCESKIVCDILEQCAAMGDWHHALDAGVATRANVYAELSEVVAGQKPGRESQEEITIFDGTGMALQDLLPRPSYTKKPRQGPGIRLNLAA